MLKVDFCDLFRIDIPHYLVSYVWLKVISFIEVAFAISNFIFSGIVKYIVRAEYTGQGFKIGRIEFFLIIDRADHDFQLGVIFVQDTFDLAQHIDLFLLDHYI